MSLINRASRNSKSSSAPFSLSCLTLIALAATVIPAQAAFIPIVKCDPTTPPPVGSLINLPGDYQVTLNLIESGVSDCILITASNVSLKLNGHVISAVNNGNAGIEVNDIPSHLNHVAIQGSGSYQGIPERGFAHQRRLCPGGPGDSSAEQPLRRLCD